MRKNCFYIPLVAVFTLLSNIGLFAQFAPNFHNFLLSDYNAGNQNWGISKAQDGKLYVANNDGLLQYDGLVWNLYELPNKTTLRSVLVIDQKVYTGSYEEFGYWETNDKGQLNYTSLSKSIKTLIEPDEEIWQIISYNKSIVFRSFSNIYIYSLNGDIKKIKPNSTVISCSVVNNELLIATLNKGIYELKQGQLVLKVMSPVLNDTKVIAAINYNNGLLIATSLKGCFLFKNNTLEPVSLEVNSFIQEHLLNTFSVMENGNMVFGTITDGVYYTDSKGKIIFHLNKEIGLLNNTILSQFIDHEYKLWLGLDNGMACIELDSHNSFFNDISGRLGAVYDVIKYNNTIYIGSNTGLYYLNEFNKLKFIEGSQGQVWDLSIIDGQLFCGHNEGTFLVNNNTLHSISSYTGGWVIKKVPDLVNTYIQGTYAGLVKFFKENEQWYSVHLGKTTMPIKYLAFQDKTTAWAAHVYKGIYKINFNKNTDSILTIENYANKGIQTDYNVRLYKIKNEVCFKTNNGWMKYEPLLDSIVPHKYLNSMVGKDAYIVSEDQLDLLAFKTKNDNIQFKSLTNQIQDFSLSQDLFENRLIVGNEKISKLSDSLLTLNLNNGFILINTNANVNVSKPKLEPPIIDKVIVNNQLISLKNAKQLEFGFNESVTVYISSPKSSKHFFQYSIENKVPQQWTKIDKNKLELSNLKDGLYTINLRAKNASGNSSTITPFNIRVLPPWYRGVKGVLLYVVLFVLFILTAFYLHKLNVKKQQRLLHLQLLKQQREVLREKTIENEKRIIKLKNESLSNEVKLKSKQLANTAMALAKKNEAIQEIKKEIVNHKKSFENTYSYKKILKQLDNSIGHDDEWELFEYNFNQVHEEFFAKLKRQFPEITQKDLRLCAYIKMNLSTKEIAPLMNISIRGVETHRYRLKRKLKLESDNSLTDFLLNLM